MIMEAVEPENLAIPERILQMLTVNRFSERLEDMATGYAFDHLQAAQILSALVIEEMLQPDRAARLVAFADRQENALTLPQVLDAIVEATWGAP